MAEVLTRSADASASRSAPELSGTVAEDLVLAVAPSTGRFRPTANAPCPVEPGDLLGHITGGQGRADAVIAPVGAQLHSLLVRPGQLVRVGEALAWMERAA